MQSINSDYSDNDYTKNIEIIKRPLSPKSELSSVNYDLHKRDFQTERIKLVPNKESKHAQTRKSPKETRRRVRCTIETSSKVDLNLNSCSYMVSKFSVHFYLFAQKQRRISSFLSTFINISREIKKIYG